MSIRTILTPATPGRPGEVVALEYRSEPPMFLAPVPYFSANDADVARLRTKLAAAETDLRHAESRNAPATELMRLEQAVRSVRQELDQAESPRRQQRRRETGAGRDDVPPQPAKNSLTWAGLRHSLDAKPAANLFAANRSAAICCAGRYLCSTCQARTATA